MQLINVVEVELNSGVHVVAECDLDDYLAELKEQGEDTTIISIKGV